MEEEYLKEKLTNLFHDFNNAKTKVEQYGIILMIFSKCANYISFIKSEWPIMYTTIQDKLTQFEQSTSSYERDVFEKFSWMKEEKNVLSKKHQNRKRNLSKMNSWK